MLAQWCPNKRMLFCHVWNGLVPQFVAPALRASSTVVGRQRVQRGRAPQHVWVVLWFNDRKQRLYSGCVSCFALNTTPRFGAAILGWETDTLVLAAVWPLWDARGFS